MAFLGKNLQMETIPEPPKGPLGRKMLKKLRIYSGPEHNHAAQCPEKLELTY